MIRIVEETFADVADREALLDRAYGDIRFTKTSEVLRSGRLPAEGLALVARDAAKNGGAVVGTVRLWNIAAGGVEALLLGPLAVEPDYQGEGVGGALMRRAVRQARLLGHGAIMLVGDEPYYSRFGFTRGLTWRLSMPGEVDRARFLALELKDGALARASGVLQPTGRFAPEAGVIPFIAARGSRGGLRLKAA